MAEETLRTPASRNKKNLVIVFWLTAVYLIVELIGGLLSGSLALLSDAGHMLTDVSGIGLALMAIRFGERPATPSQTYGYYRAEILAALFNAVVLIGVSLYILYEAYQRFQAPPAVHSTMLLWVAGVGLVVNLIGIRIMHSGSKESLNMKGAYFEVLSDLLTSIGVIIAGIIMITTGWYLADPIISAGIGLFILPRAWSLIKDSVHILLEGTPTDVDIEKLRTAMMSISGVTTVHDVHVWSLTSGVHAMSAHAGLTEEADPERVLEALYQLITNDFEIAHVTIQLERPNWKHKGIHR